MAASIKLLQDILGIKFFATVPRARASKFAHRNVRPREKEKNKVQENQSFLHKYS